MAVGATKDNGTVRSMVLPNGTVMLFGKKVKHGLEVFQTRET